MSGLAIGGGALFIILVVAFVGGCILIIFNSHRKVAAKINGLPSFDDYKNLNSNLVKNGKVECRSCGGSRIFVRREGSLFTGIVNLHVCTACGTNLYRSKP